ncbi:MAG: hypothetical protein JNM91_00040, partial [Flavobacteriales bacterium]|nr:hypothetical protein [Flavobacteriales bacterium]
MRSILFFPFLLWSIPAFTSETRPVQPSTGYVPIGRSIEHFADEAAQLSAEEAYRQPGFSLCGSEVPNLGISGAAHWLRFQVHNSTQDAGLVLGLPHPEIDELDLFLDGDGRLEHIASVGQSRTHPWRNDEGQEFSFNLRIAPGGTATVLLRLKSNKQLQVPVILTSASEASALLATRNLAFGCYVGIMAVMALYNLFLFLSIRDRGYLMYVFYIVAVTLTQLTLFGFGQHYLWSASAWLSSNASIILTLLTAVLATEFMKAFLITKDLLPRTHKLFAWFYGAFAISLAVYLFGDPITGYRMAQAISGL